MREAQHGKYIAEHFPRGAGSGGKLGFQRSKAKGQGGAVNTVDVRGIDDQHRFEERAKLGRL